MRVSISLTAFDGTLSQTIHATHMYWPEKMVWDARFVDMMSPMSDGGTLMDFGKFHEVQKLQP